MDIKERTQNLITADSMGIFQQIPLDGTGESKSIDVKLELSLCEVRATDKIEPPVIALKIGDSIVSTLGNILTLIGKAKSRKSFLISIAIAVAVSKDYIFNLFTSCLPNDKQIILLFDTEQSKYHVQLALLRICKMTGIDEPRNLKVYGLRKYSPAERLQIIEYAIYNTPNLGIVFIDGAKDLITSINDEDQASMLVSKFLKWTEELNISIVTVLHQNKSDTNARGHIGTELMNKSETVLSVTKSEADKEISIVNPEACRNMDFDPFAFEINEFGIPVIAENFEMRTATKKDKFDVLDLADYKKYQLLTEIFSREKECTFKMLETQLQLAYKNQFQKSIGINAVGKLITDCKNNNWILQAEKRAPYTLGEFDELSL
ncbi:mobilization protein [Flavobacterium yafengii]|uniref:mobilization protein n=1 Tax=Flavobacterium yafengii TaxID=3041253 RepID=UPI0024A8ABD4|nr:mobilization protein [Flavobacterium yafengii]MDI5899645.1 mobilization protein [Flavobacterium yafengii]